MSITIRLSREGKKNSPSFKLVVANTRDKARGVYLDILGHYNPSKNPVELELDKKKLSDWKNKGALVTKAVEDLVAGKYQYIKYAPKKEKAAEPQTAEPAKEQSL